MIVTQRTHETFPTWLMSGVMTFGTEDPKGVLLSAVAMSVFTHQKVSSKEDMGGPNSENGISRRK